MVRIAEIESPRRNSDNVEVNDAHAHIFLCLTPLVRNKMVRALMALCRWVLPDAGWRRYASTLSLVVATNVLTAIVFHQYSRDDGARNCKSRDSYT